MVSSVGQATGRVLSAGRRQGPPLGTPGRKQWGDNQALFAGGHPLTTSPISVLNEVNR